MASSYHQLGIVAQHRGDLDQAEDWYRQSLTINEQLGNRPGMATTYGALGQLAEARSDEETALRLVIRSVALFETFPHPSARANAAHLVRLTGQLGEAALAQGWEHVTGQRLPDQVRHVVAENLKTPQDQDNRSQNEGEGEEQ